MARRYAAHGWLPTGVAFAAVTRDEWIARFAELAQVPVPSAKQVDALLALAGVAAHASERTAAPLACWIAGRSQLSPTQLCELAEAVSDEAQ